MEQDFFLRPPRVDTRSLEEKVGIVGFLFRKQSTRLPSATMMPMIVEQFFTAFLVIQLAHSAEELATGFHRRFPPFKMSFRFFLIFELLFNAFWICVFLFDVFPARVPLMAFFNILMFANGMWHIIWFWFCEKGKRYVPGLITAPVHIILFLVYYGLMLR
ncbi:MAG: HXXEE domain-containing protein [Candidatus Peribacteraceae bacterium]|nr:HXXEE domain-containing protein [Candidatus Peribacteraceae bacterium]